MNVISRTFSLFLWLVSAGSAALAAPLIPLQKGTAWIYEGMVEWQQGSEIKSEKIRLTTEVIKAFAYRKGRIAVVRDFPSELVRYENGRLPRYSVLIENKTNVFCLSADSKDEAIRLERELLRKSNNLPVDSILYKPQLKCGRSQLHIKGIDARRKFKCEQFSRRTNPDIETIDFVRGAGIIRYYYDHFGTTASVNIKLKAVRFPGKINRKKQI